MPQMRCGLSDRDRSQRLGTAIRQRGMTVAEYTNGWNAAIRQAAAIAEVWRDENKVACNKARLKGRKRHSFDGDETQLVLAEQLDGAAIECNAIAAAIRELAITRTESSQ